MYEDTPAIPAGSRPLRLHHDRFPGRPLLDTAVSHAMLRRVASGLTAESLRLYIPDRALLFSSLDARRPGFGRAIEIAEAAGFPAVIRLAGGQAAAFLEESLAFAWAIPDDDAHLHIRGRFEVLSNRIVASLQKLGLDARVGPVPGEYCPGDYSVNIAGHTKVMGVGQRVIRGGAHIGGVITVGQSQSLRETLIRVYEALGFDFRPETAGGIGDFDPNLGTGELKAAMLEVLSEAGYSTEDRNFENSIVEEAQALIPLHSAKERKPGSLRGVLRARRGDPKTLIQHEANTPSSEMPRTSRGRRPVTTQGDVDS